MTRQYAINVKDFTYEELLRFGKFISEERLKRADRYRFDKDKIRCLTAELILRYALITEYGINNDSIQFIKSDKGKPYLKSEHINVEFNLSHSGDYVVCAISDSPVGIDVEQIRDKDINIAKRVLTKDEYEEWSALDDGIKTDEFYRLWTVKESYSKYLGLGLMLDFSLEGCSQIKRGISSDYNLNFIECIIGSGSGYVYSQKLDDSHYLSVCIAPCKKDELIKEVQYIGLEDIKREIILNGLPA